MDLMRGQYLVKTPPSLRNELCKIPDLLQEHCGEIHWERFFNIFKTWEFWHNEEVVRWYEDARYSVNIY